MNYIQLSTPLGPFRADLVEGAVSHAWFVNGGRARNDAPAVYDALHAYFGGDIGALDAIVVRAVGTTFQQRVWAALREIPVGHTWSYRDIAEHIGAPSASRAVGSANASNPVGVIVPCHRVVRADGSIGGYAGGLERKRWLLEHEGALVRGGLL